MSNNSLFPENNRVVAELLFVLEVGLRELIIKVLSAIDGSKWYKTLLPADVTQKYHRGRQSERAAKWTNHVEHHPLYYIDFPDLLKVLEKNWKATFQGLFGEKTVFVGNLKSLEPIRNKLAHNRKLSEQDRVIVEGVHATFESAIGIERLMALVQNCSDAPSIPQIIEELINEVKNTRDTMSSLGAPVLLIRWPDVKDAWWFDSHFLGDANYASELEVAEARYKDLQETVERTSKQIESLRAAMGKTVSPGTDVLEPVRQHFDIYADFEQQPRSRGMGHRLEAWRDKRDILGSADAAINSLTFLKPGERT